MGDYCPQEETEKQPQATLSGILRENKRRSQLGDSFTQQDPEGGGVAGCEVGIMGQRQENPRWANDLVW